MSPKTMSYALRRATPADAPQISTLIGTTWSKFFGYSVTPDDLAAYLSGPLSVPSIQSEVENPLMRLIVAVSFSDIIGVAHLVTHSTEPCLQRQNSIELRRIYVDEAHHGKGVAGVLISQAESLARSENYESIWLGVWEENPKAQRFYEKMGFKPVGEHEFLVGESSRRDWILEKIL